jgi:hypothetical protein
LVPDGLRHFTSQLAAVKYDLLPPGGYRPPVPLTSNPPACADRDVGFPPNERRSLGIYCSTRRIAIPGHPEGPSEEVWGGIALVGIDREYSRGGVERCCSTPQSHSEATFRWERTHRGVGQGIRAASFHPPGLPDRGHLTCGRIRAGPMMCIPCWLWKLLSPDWITAIGTILAAVGTILAVIVAMLWCGPLN